MTLNMLLEWWNLVYLVPFSLALAYLAVFVFTGLTFGDGGVELHAEPDADADVDADADGDADGDHDAEGEHEGETQVWGMLLGMLGAGKVPLSLGVMMLLLFWGLIGFGMNVVLVEWARMGAWTPAVSLPATLAMSVALTGALASVMARVVPLNEETPLRREDLVGRPGEALYEITETFGMAAVRSARGDLMQVACKAGAGQRIAKGSRVVLFAYDRGAGMFSAALLE